MSGKKVERNSGAQVVGIEQGGTGATTAPGALAALGAVPSALMAKPLGCISLDKDGRASPGDLGLSVAGQPAVVGPQEIAYGSRVNYVITNFDSFLNYDVRAVSGSVTLRDDVIEYTAPPASSGLSKGGFTVGGRTYEIAFSVARVAKPVITWPTEGYSITANDSNPTARLSAFSVSGGNAVKTGELQGKGSTVLTTGQNNSNRTIRFVGRGGAGYMLGGIAVKGQDAVIRQNGAPIATFPGGLGVTAPLTNLNGIPFTEGMQVSFDIPDSNEIKYFVYDEAGVLATTEWQVATTPDFSSPLVNTGAVTNFNAGLPLNFAMTKGQRYYVRARQAGLDGTISEWSDVVSFYYQYTANSGSLYSLHSSINLRDHPLGYGTDTKQIRAFNYGLGFVKGYATVSVSDAASSNWTIRNDFQPSPISGTLPRAIEPVSSFNSNELLLLESQTSAQPNQIGTLHYGGTGVATTTPAVIEVDLTKGNFPEPFYPGNLWNQKIAKNPPISLALAADYQRAFTMSANERHVAVAYRRSSLTDDPAVQYAKGTPYRYDSWNINKSPSANGVPYINGYLNFASMFEFWAINRDNWKNHPTDSSLFAMRADGAYNFRRRRNANDNMETEPTLLAGAQGLFAASKASQVLVVAPKRSWRETYGENGQVISSQKGCDVAITTFLPNGEGDPYLQSSPVKMDIMIHAVNGRVDGKRVANTEWRAAMDSHGMFLMIADLKDYGGRGVVSIYKNKTLNDRTLQQQPSAGMPYKKQKFAGTMNFREIQQPAASTYLNPTGADASIAFSSEHMLGVPTTVKVKQRITVANGGSSYEVTQNFYLDSVKASAGVSAPVLNFGLEVTYVNSSEEWVYEQGDVNGNPSRIVFDATVSVESDPDFPSQMFNSIWELYAVIPGDPSGMMEFGCQMAINSSNSVCVIGYKDTNAANAVRYRVFENANFSSDFIAGSKQAVQIPGTEWVRDKTSAGVTVPFSLKRNNDVAFAPNGNLGVVGISPVIRYAKDGAFGSMAITSAQFDGSRLIVNYQDASNGATATYTTNSFSGVIRGYKQIDTISPSFPDANCMDLIGTATGSRVFVAKAGKVEVFQR